MTSVSTINSTYDNNGNDDNHYDRQPKPINSCHSPDGLSKDHFDQWPDVLTHNDHEYLQLELLPENLHSSPKPHRKARTFASFEAENSSSNTNPLNLKEPFDLDENAISHLVKISPSGSSVVTDDSGYGHTQFSDTINSTTINNTQMKNLNNVKPNKSVVQACEQQDDLKMDYRDEFLSVMIEDLVDWLTNMYPNLAGELNIDNFFDRLSDGVLLCHHANLLHNLLLEEVGQTALTNSRKLNGFRIGGVQALLPSCSPAYQKRGLNLNNATSSFVSRDNVSSFIRWCRQLGMPDSILFESEDLVCRKNPRNVVVCLLELARLGGRVGMAIPELVQLEVEIDEQLASEAEWDKTGRRQQDSESSNCSSAQAKLHFYEWHRDSAQDRDGGGQEEADERWTDSMNNENPSSKDFGKKHPYRTNRSTELRIQEHAKHARTNSSSRLRETKAEEPQTKKKEIIRPKVDLRSLDEIVRDLLSQCTCKQTFPMTRIGEGRYLFGDKSTQIFVRILRSHVMVRVGGGWDTLNHFLEKYDECRKANPPSHGPANVTTTNDPKAVDITDKNQVIRAVKESTPPGMFNGPFIGQGNLSVVKKTHPTHSDAQSMDEFSSDIKCCTNHNGTNSLSDVIKPQITKSQSKPSTQMALRKTFISHSQNDLRNAHKTNSNTTKLPQKWNKVCTIDIPDNSYSNKRDVALTAPTSPTSASNSNVRSISSKIAVPKPTSPGVNGSNRVSNQVAASKLKSGNSVERASIRRRKSEANLATRKLPVILNDQPKPRACEEDELIFTPCKPSVSKSLNNKLSKSVGSLANRSRTRTITNIQSTNSSQISQIKNQITRTDAKPTTMRHNSETPLTLKPLKTNPSSAQIRERFARSPSYDWKTGRRLDTINMTSAHNQPQQKRIEQPLFGHFTNQTQHPEIPSSSTSTTVSLSSSQDFLCDKAVTIKPRRSSLIPLPIRSHSSSRIPVPINLNSVISKVPEI